MIPKSALGRHLAFSTSNLCAFLCIFMYLLLPRVNSTDIHRYDITLLFEGQLAGVDEKKNRWISINFLLSESKNDRTDDGTITQDSCLDLLDGQL